MLTYCPSIRRKATLWQTMRDGDLAQKHQVTWVVFGRLEKQAGDLAGGIINRFQKAKRWMSRS